MNTYDFSEVRGVGGYFPKVLSIEQLEELRKYHLFPTYQPYTTSIPLDTDYGSDYYRPVVELLATYIQDQQDILIYGDYDCDGMTATAALYYILSKIHSSSKLKYYIPSRLDGYGLKYAQVKAVTEGRPCIVVTVDNGISAIDTEILPLLKEGYKVIVTDHHLPGENYTAHPDVPVLNPKVLVEPDHPEYMVSGCWVSAKLGWKLYKYFTSDVDEEVLPILSQFVSLSIISDVIPTHNPDDPSQVYDNIIFQLLYGFGCSYTTKHDGLYALLCRLGLYYGGYTASTCTYRVAPMINSAGRMDRTQLAMQLLLLVHDPTEGEQARAYALALEKNNTTRRANTDVEAAIALEAITASTNCLRENSIVYYHPDLALGLVGLLAGKIQDRHQRTTIILAKHPLTGKIHGSARSSKGVDIHAVLPKLAKLGIHGGGHQRAMGIGFDERLTPEEEHQRIEQLRDIVEEHCKEYASAQEQPATTAELEVDIATLQNVQFQLFMDSLEPTVRDNPSPVYILRDLTVSILYSQSNPGFSLVVLLGKDRQNHAIRLQQFSPIVDWDDLQERKCRLDIKVTGFRSTRSSHFGEFTWNIEEVIDVRDQ